MQEYVVKLTLATLPENRENLLASKYIRYGSSPRGAQTLILGGESARVAGWPLQRQYGRHSRAAASSALRHRIILNFEAQADGRTTDDLLDEIAGKICEVRFSSTGFSLCGG